MLFSLDLDFRERKKSALFACKDRVKVHLMAQIKKSVKELNPRENC